MSLARSDWACPVHLRATADPVVLLRRGDPGIDLTLIACLARGAHLLDGQAVVRATSADVSKASLRGTSFRRHWVRVRLVRLVPLFNELYVT